jgi:tetraprenyl-beta-curcumene synthase
VRSTSSGSTPAIQTGAALLIANVRYWKDVAPQVRRELRRWSQRATLIADPHLREIAIGKLEREHFNAEVAATLATLAPEPHRGRTVEAIVAFEVLYDYLDGLTEEPAEDPLQGRARLYRAFTTVFDGSSPRASAGGEHEARDGGYVAELAAVASEAIATLPGRAPVSAAGRRAAERCAAAQARVHAASQLGAGELERWARAAVDREGALGWREHVAGAVASVLAVHALIVAAADESVTEQRAEALADAYLWISALSTMLDSLVDYRRDSASGDPWLLRLYGGDTDLFGDRLVDVARGALARARLLPRGPHHLMTLIGVCAYYSSAPEARSALARPVVARLHSELRPGILPTLAVMRAWRLAKRVRRRLVKRLRRPPAGDASPSASR